mmetsp:Transcript_9059/g.19550  ORF Transcript_9059/g.19550 Transcript_9059/m.19550 type:complete len:261 (+) Transcript_9059:292-1074(+)
MGQHVGGAVRHSWRRYPQQTMQQIVHIRRLRGVLQHRRALDIFLSREHGVWSLPVESLIKHDSETPKVDANSRSSFQASCIGVGFEILPLHLGTAVHRSAGKRLHTLLGGGRHSAAETKIGEHDAEVAVDCARSAEQILRFEVAVGQEVAVEISQRLCKLAKEDASFGMCKRLSRSPTEARQPSGRQREKLEDDEYVFLRFVRPGVHLADVGVLELFVNLVLLVHVRVGTAELSKACDSFEGDNATALNAAIWPLLRRGF